MDHCSRTRTVSATSCEGKRRTRKTHPELLQQHLGINLLDRDFVLLAPGNRDAASRKRRPAFSTTVPRSRQSSTRNAPRVQVIDLASAERHVLERLTGLHVAFKGGDTLPAGLASVLCAATTQPCAADALYSCGSCARGFLELGLQDFFFLLQLGHCGVVVLAHALLMVAKDGHLLVRFIVLQARANECVSECRCRQSQAPLRT